MAFIILEVCDSYKKIPVNNKTSAVKIRVNFLKFAFSFWDICKLVYIILHVTIHFLFYLLFPLVLYKVLLRLYK